MQGIYILEDDPTYLTFLEHEVHNTAMIENLPYELRLATADPQAIIDDVAQFEQERCLFLLDIEIEHAELNGVQLATFIRTHATDADILFITSHPESALLIITRKIMPLDLIQKSLSADTLRAKLHQDLLDVADQLQHADQRLNFTVASTIHSVSLEQVIALATTPDDPGTLQLFCENETASFPGSLIEYEAQYPTLFRCHKSFLINVDKVVTFDSKRRVLIFNDGSHAEVSFRKVATLKKMLQHRPR